MSVSATIARSPVVYRRRLISWINLASSVLVLGTGVVLLFHFHVGGGAHRGEWLGMSRQVWVAVHQLGAIAFPVGFGVHLWLHGRYIRGVAQRWRKGLPDRTKSAVRSQGGAWCQCSRFPIRT